MSRKRLTIRPANGIAGTLEDWSQSRLPWESVVQDIESVVVEEGVSAVTCKCMFASYKGLYCADLINECKGVPGFWGFEFRYVVVSGMLV